MKNLSIALTILILSSCSKKNTLATSVMNEQNFLCAYCEDFIQNRDHIPIERDVTTFGLHHVEFVTESDRIIVQWEFEYIMPWKPGPMIIYSLDEWGRLNDSRYCFIGKSKSELREMFKDNEDEVSTTNGLHFYFFNGVVPKPRDGKPTDFRVEKMQYLQFVNFDTDSIFVGSANDSLMLKKCIEQGLKK